jgi:hypothetical protein
MKKTAVSRIVTTVLVVVSLLFAQLALAQFVCPVAQAAETEMTMPCEGMDHEADSQPPSALCHHHCTNAAQSFEPVKLPTLTLPAVVQVIVMPLVVDVAHERALVAATTGEAQPPPAPVFLSTLRLRV